MWLKEALTLRAHQKATNCDAFLCARVEDFIVLYELKFWPIILNFFLEFFHQILSQHFLFAHL